MTAAIVLVYLIYFYAIVFESQEKVFKTSVNERLPCPSTSSFYREPDRMSAQTLYRQKLDSLPKIRTANGVCLSLLVFTPGPKIVCFGTQNV